MKSSLLRGVLAAVAAIVLIAILRFKPWQPAADSGDTGSKSTTQSPGGIIPKTADQRFELAVGFLPVTCHLTCPVTDFASKTSGQNRFVSQRFTDFPTVVETLKSGRMEAAFMIAPLAMKIREQGVPVHIVYLGHRDGSTVMVRKDLNIRNLRDLRGKTFAIPSKFSNQYLVISKLMERESIQPSEIKFVELAPPDMPASLKAKAIDAYFVGEPHAAKAELDGSGKVLYMAKDIWPGFISCVLVVTDKLIKEKPEVVRDLVRGVAESGEWAETHRLEAAKLAAPYYKQKEKLLRYVLTTPKNRVSYRMLAPEDKDLAEIQDMGIKMGILKKKLPITDIVDRQFIPKDIKPAPIEDASIPASAT